jgi:hypothetical protein
MEATRAEGKGFLDLSRLHRADYIGFAGAGVLFISLFLPWFSTSSSNQNSIIDGKRGSFTAWEVFSTLDWLLLAACTAPFVLAWIIARGHALSWRPGEVTMIVGITAFALIVMNGLILGKPGDTVGVGFKIGYPVALLGAALICLGGVIRQAEGVKGRKPPGTF